MITVLVFSKDRPLQLNGYLDSLFTFSNINQKQVYVLYKETETIKYDLIISKFFEVNWVKEDIFYKNLLEIVLKADDYILFGCDDVVIKNNINIFESLYVLKNNAQIFGYSFRLGLNISPYPESVKDNGSHLIWNWTEVTETHWNYPWEVTGTIYRKSDVENIILSDTSLITPNFLEGNIASNPKKYIKKPLLASDKEGKIIVITINRVQETHQNPVDSHRFTDINFCYDLFIKGDTLDIHAISKKKHRSIQVDSSFFILKKNKNKYSYRKNIQNSINIVFIGFKKILKTILKGLR